MDELLAWTGGKGVDVVIEASGANAALEQAIGSMAKQGKLVLVGRQEGPVQMAARTFETLLRRQLDLLGTWAWSRLPAVEWRVALDFAARGSIQVKPLISHRVSIEQISDTFEMIAGGREAANKVLFVFS